MEEIDADGNITVRVRTDIDVLDSKLEEKRGIAVQADNQWSINTREGRNHFGDVIRNYVSAHMRNQWPRY
jgi:hypothetical protein